MELFSKQYLPILFLFYTIWYRKRNKNVNFGVILLFYSYYLLSSNFSFDIYRIIHQFILFALLIYNLVHVKKLSRNVLKFILLFLTAILISGLFNNVQKDTYFAVVINYIFNLSAILFLCIKIRCLDELYDSLRYITNIGWLLSVFAIITFIVEPTRIELVSSNPNYLAFALGVSFIISLFIKRNILINLIPLLGIFVTASRSILLICVFIFLITQFKFYKAKILLFMPVFTLFILFTFIYEGDFSGFDSLVLIRFENLENDESLLVRYEIYKAAEQIITEHPLVGIGYGQFTKYNPLNALFSDKMQGIVTHNDYIRIITELGIVGAILFLIMTITIFKKTFKIPKLFKELCLSLLVMTLFFSASHNNLNSFMFWLILFLPIIIYNLRSKTHEYKAIA